MKYTTVDNLIDEILKIPGDKIVTLTSDDDYFTIDIAENKNIGYAAFHKVLFTTKLAKAMQVGGGMIIRQFLSIRAKRTAANGKEMWLPEKNLYGVLLSNNKWEGLDPQDVKLACETDSKTGKPTSGEDGVHYKAFPLVR